MIQTLTAVDADTARYFVHDKYVGLAAFQSAEATEAERNARFMSVGILAARERIWLHAPALKDLAR